MTAALTMQTARLHLRRWCDADREPFAAMNQDPEVMAFFPALQSRDLSDAAIDAWEAQFESQGFSNWAVQLIDTGEFAGFVGITVPRRTLPFSPCVEIGWRLARPHWGRGLATEAATEVLRTAFERIGLDEIVSFTTLSNAPSRAVMERIGMRNTGQDFDHPGVPAHHPLRPHCLYRITRGEWAQRGRVASHC